MSFVPFILKAGSCSLLLCAVTCMGGCAGGFHSADGPQETIAPDASSGAVTTTGCANCGSSECGEGQACASPEDNYPELLCYGYRPTCWYPWPAECKGCTKLPSTRIGPDNGPPQLQRLPMTLPPESPIEEGPPDPDKTFRDSSGQDIFLSLYELVE